MSSLPREARVSFGDHKPVPHRLDYAVRALVALARAGSALTAEQIGSAEAIPHRYLLRIFRDLVSHGVLESRRGRHGGFALAQAPETLTVADVVRMLTHHASDTGPPAVNSVLRLWSAADAAGQDVLASVTIADLARAEASAG